MRPPLRHGFSLVELLVSFALLAIIVAIVVPRYIGLQRGTNIQVATQQVDAIRKAIQAWSASLPSLSDVSRIYNSDANATAMSAATWNSIATNYLDPSFTSRITVSGDPVDYLVTAEMRNITGAGAYVAQNAPTGFVAPSTPTLTPRSAYAVITWPTNNRRTTLPSVVLFVPNP